MPLPKLPFPPQSDSYELVNGSDTVEVQVEGGRSRKRRDYNSKSFELSVSWILDQAEYQYFKSFYNTGILKGSLPFLIDLIIDNPFLEEYTAHFKADSLNTSNPQGLAIFVKATLEILPRTTTDFDFAVMSYGLSDFDFFLTFEQFVNYDLLVPVVTPYDLP